MHFTLFIFHICNLLLMKKSILSLALLFFICSLLTDGFAQKNSSSLFTESKFSEVVAKSRKKLDANDIDGALKILDEAIAKKVDLYEVYSHRYFIRHYYLRDFDGAIADIEKVLEIKPDDFSSYLSLGSLKESKKDYSGALKVYETAQKYQPQSIEISVRKAFIKSNLKDFAGAMAEIQTALQNSPDSIGLQIQISQLLTVNKKPEQAISSLQSFLDDYVKKNNGELPKLKGEKVKKSKIIHNPDGSSGEKVRRYSRMDFSANSSEDLKRQQDKIEEIRNLAKAYTVLGKLYIAQNDYQKAFKNLDTALLIDKNHEEAYGMRGAVYLSTGEYEKAITEFTAAADIADEPYFYLSRGIAYLLIKNDKSAQSDFDYFLKIYPDGKAILDQRIAEAKQKLAQ